MVSILIVYPKIAIGGSTTSLLSILNLFDYSKYEIDLALGNKGGELEKYIPNEINIISPLLPSDLLQKKKNVISVTKKVFARLISTARRSKNIENQIMSYENARFCKRIEKYYDIAISFLEGYSLYYVANYVNAKYKIAWIHVDYIAAGFLNLIDINTYSKIDKFVLVSEACKESFDKAFPKYAGNSIIIPNILSKEVIEKRSEEDILFTVEEDVLNFVTTCRIDLASKALDRSVKAFYEVRKKNPAFNFKWYIIGDGPDLEDLRTVIKKYEMQDYIILLGKRINPLPIVKKMTLFFLPSKYEGKPMSVTEAQILRVPPVVTKYASADSQVNNMIDGLVMENSLEGIIKGLQFIFENKEIISEWKKNIKNTRYDNIEDFQYVERLIEEHELK